jgi:hypothetical protein
MENRSFHYFQHCTLPNWTEFFDSELWSQKIMQLSHVEPAIKHGVLALSTLHELFQETTVMMGTKSNDFAFVQYMQAVRHSNDLLTAHQEGRVNVEKVLIACIIFVCYENLAGNYRAANMHLQNGLRIVNQQRLLQLPGQPPACHPSISSILYRFDLQSMAFSDNASPYEYGLDSPPECPPITGAYTKNDAARDDLVGMWRCMMWISSIANINPQAPEDPAWLSIYSQLMAAFIAWDKSFEAYLREIPPHEQGNPKTYAGNTLLKMYAILARIIVAAGAGHRTEKSWDPLIDSFKTIVDLAETLPILTKPPPAQPSLKNSESPSPSGTPIRGRAKRSRSIAPNPAHSTPSPPPGASQLTFRTEPTISPPPRSHTPSSHPAGPQQKHSSFTPSFELSSIIPLFMVACRCRDPMLRRRALRLLLSCRRREGAWDSFGAGMVAMQCIKMEEGIDAATELGPDNWLPLSPTCTDAEQIEDEKRVDNIFVSVNQGERQIGVNYLMRSGEAFDRMLTF